MFNLGIRRDAVWLWAVCIGHDPHAKELEGWQHVGGWLIDPVSVLSSPDIGGNNLESGLGQLRNVTGQFFQNIDRRQTDLKMIAAEICSGVAKQLALVPAERQAGLQSSRFGLVRCGLEPSPRKPGTDACRKRQEEIADDL